MITPTTTQLLYLCEAADVPDDEGLRLRHTELPETVAVFVSKGQYYAIGDTCSHADASLAEGWVENGKVECPLHFARFDLATGKACSLPATFPVKTYPVTVVDGKVYLNHSEVVVAQQSPLTPTWVQPEKRCPPSGRSSRLSLPSAPTPCPGPDQVVG